MLRASHRLVAALLAPIALLLAPSVHGQQAGEEEASRAEEEGEVPLAGEIGFASTNHYLFRGIPVEDRGFIAQPWTSLDLRLMCFDACIRELHVIGGLWMSIHSEKTDATAPPEAWYELAFHGGVSLRMPKKTWVAVLYQGRTSPNDAFPMLHELHLRGRMDLSGDARDWWLQPQARIVATLGPPSARSLYGDIGLEAGWTLVDTNKVSFDLFVPASVGFTLAGRVRGTDRSGARYRFTRFGGGASLAFPAPDKEWELYALVEGWALGSAFHDDLGRGRAVNVVGSGGVKWTFGQYWVPDPSRIPAPR